MQTYTTALVLGLASSGEAAARLLRREGAAVTVVDRADTDALRQRAAALTELGVRVLLGQADLPEGDFDVCVVSPGVPLQSPWIQNATARNLNVISELEFGWSRARCRVLAITGSNGKSTLVKFCADVLAHAGFSVAIAGNYGPPVCDVVSEHPALDWLVLEVSSFQLETVKRFRPDVGVLLNMYPNHIDRHGTFDEYLRMKSRLFAAMQPGDTAVVPMEECERIRQRAGAGGRWLTFGLGGDASYVYRAGAVWNAPRGCVTNVAETLFANDVLGLTCAAAAAALIPVGIAPDHLEAAARAFQRLPHRTETIGVVNGVTFVDDSKATNAAAMIAALKMASRPVRLIAGGLPKHESYAPACEVLKQKAVGVYLIGAAAEDMAATWRAVVPCERCGTLEQAVEMAWSQASPGETILLSPACASFDQFRSYAERGRVFKQCMNALTGV